MSAVTTIDYFIKHKSGKYRFTIRISYDPTKSGAASRRWKLINLVGNAPLVIARAKGGDWEWNQSSTTSYFSIYDGATDQLLFYLDDVPSDYLHGNFCSISSGPGGYRQGETDVYDLIWTVYGPGCV